MFIAMTGQKRSGKDTVAAFINEWEPSVERISFAGTLKGMIALLLRNAGLTEEEIDYYMNGDGKETELAVLQYKSARYAMQTLGTEWRDMLGKDLWTDIVRSKVGLTENVVITDMRFLHEERFVEEHEGAKVRVVRAGQPAVSADAHKSEQEMAAIRADYVIFNHGSLLDLRVAAAIVYGAVARF